MKRICEIYDISKDYEMPIGTVLIIVSDIEKGKIISMLLNTKLKEDMVFNNTEWQEYLEINNKYNRNEAKHQMREIRQSKRLESDVSHIYEIDIGESLENEEIEMYLKKFILNLNPVQRRRFPMFDGVEKLFVSWKEKQDKAKKELGRRWRLPKEFENLVFTSSLGSPLTRYVLSNDINKIVSILNKNEEYLAEQENRKPQKFPKLHPHSFRHTFATRCFEKNLKPVFIMSIMGHSNYETTLSYTHLLKKSNDQQVSLAGSFV